MLWEYCSFLWYIWNGYFMLRSWWYRVFVMMWLFPVTMVLCDVMLWIFHVEMVIHVMPWLINVKVIFYVKVVFMLILMWLFHGTVHVVFLWEDGFIYAVIISCEGSFKYLIWRWSLGTKLSKKQYINCYINSI